jgi:ABC-type Mn2+/Zn2+ transport system permease subunit
MRRTAIGIVFAAAGLGVALMSIKTYSTDLTHILFGNVLE